MVSDSPADFLQLLAHDLRWQILSALAHSDRRVQELVALLGRPMNLVSYHLRLLRTAGLVHEHRSSADGRDLYYTLALSELAQRFQTAGLRLHPALGCPATSPAQQTPLRVLFLCTRNSARSQMAEGLLRTRAGARPIAVFSAGSEPAEVDPDTIRAMAALDINVTGQRAKRLDVFDGKAFDYVITVCDQMREQCPTWPGDPDMRHWSVPDPAGVGGTPQERLAAFTATAQDLARRVEHFLLVLDAEAGQPDPQAA